MDTSEVNSEDNILLCQYLRWFDNGTIHLDEVTYLNEVNCSKSNAEVVWTQYIVADPSDNSQVSQYRPLYEPTFTNYNYAKSFVELLIACADKN